MISCMLVEFFLTKLVDYLSIGHKCKIKDNMCSFFGKLLFQHLCQQCESNCTHKSLKAQRAQHFICLQRKLWVCVHWKFAFIKRKRQEITGSNAFFSWRCQVPIWLHRWTQCCSLSLDDFDRFPNQIRMGRNAPRCLLHLSFFPSAVMPGHCSVMGLVGLVCLFVSKITIFFLELIFP